MQRVKLDPGFLHAVFPDDEKAIALWSFALTLAPVNPEALFQRARSNERIRRFASALADYGSYLALANRNDERRVDALFHSAEIHQRLQDHAAALNDLEQLLPLNPASVVLAQMCNNVAWMTGAVPGAKYGPRALMLAQKAMELQPYESMYRNTLGVILYRLGRYPEVKECLERNGTFSETLTAFDLYFLAMAEQRMGRTHAARDYYARADSWWQDHQGLSPGETTELTAFRTEALSLLGLTSSLHN
jgi:tetratricopeptide (TPR) repeat protein